MVLKMQKDNYDHLLKAVEVILVQYVFVFLIEWMYIQSVWFELVEVLVIEHLESAVRNQYLRHADTLWSLVVLQDGCYDTWQGESRTVQCVAKLNLLVLSMAVAAVEAVSLIALEVGY